MSVYKKVNQGFFSNWTIEMAYVLGFFMADGSMNKNSRGAHFFNIQICDRALLYAIRKALDSEHKISTMPAKNNDSAKYRLQIGSKKIYRDLQNLGLQSRKARNLSMPTVPKKMVGHFVRGYFDGDGHVWTGLVHKDRPHPLSVLFAVFTSCSGDFLASLQKTLSENGVGKGSLVRTNQGFYRLQYSIKDSLLLADLMYRKSFGSLYLKRKKDIFDRFKSKRMRA